MNLQAKSELAMGGSGLPFDGIARARVQAGVIGIKVAAILFQIPVLILKKLIYRESTIAERRRERVGIVNIIR
jgi:hypothetical protein